MSCSFQQLASLQKSGRAERRGERERVLEQTGEKWDEYECVIYKYMLYIFVRKGRRMEWERGEREAALTCNVEENSAAALTGTS